MEIYDIVMLTILGIAIIFGAVKGLAWQIATIASLVVSYFVAMNFFPHVAPYIQAQKPWNEYAGMAILYLGTSLGIWILFGVVRRQIDNLKLNGFDRQAGALLGAVSGLILCVVVTMFSVALMNAEQRKVIVDSKSGYYIAQIIKNAKSIFPENIQATVNPLIDQFNERFHQKEDPTNPQNNPSGINAGIELIKKQNPNHAGTIDQFQKSEVGKQLIDQFGKQIQNNLNGNSGNSSSSSGFFPTTLDGYQNDRK